MIRKKDLPDLEKSKGLFLYCTNCGRESSANKGDYFNYHDEYIFMCCSQNMVLAREKRILEIISKGEEDVN